MKIKTIHLVGFKRFTDLTISEIPESAKLVVLTGPNGVGKSSLFEAFNVYLQRSKNNNQFEVGYHPKFQTLPSPTDQVGAGSPVNPVNNWDSLVRNVTIEFHGNDEFNIHGQMEERHQKAFYIRSSYRFEPDFEATSLQRQGDVLLDGRRPQYLISLDARVSDNYQRIVASAVGEVFDRTNETVTAGQIRERLIGEAATSLRRILPDLLLTGAGDPLSDGTFLFEKGASKDWKYKNLSGGEKAAFDLILDFVVKRESFNNTVFCIDEPESHMNTRVQAALLEEMYGKIPDGCQLWIATHSIGMMRAAQALYEANPESVVFLDFDLHNFDEAVEITPSTPSREFWKRQLDVAIGDLADLIAPSNLVFCEGSRIGTRNPEFDARCYRTIFSNQFPGTEFVSIGGSTELERNTLLVMSVIKDVVASLTHVRLYDLDDLSTAEVADRRAGGGRVLSRRDLESFLFDDEVLTKLCIANDQEPLVPTILAAKQTALQNSVRRGNPLDDIKSAAGEIYTQTKRILGLTQCGNTAIAFASDTLAPLITPELAVYQDLKRDIFG